MVLYIYLSVCHLVCEAEYCFKVCYFSAPLFELHFILVKLRFGIVLRDLRRYS